MSLFIPGVLLAMVFYGCYKLHGMLNIPAVLNIPDWLSPVGFYLVCYVITWLFGQLLMGSFSEHGLGVSLGQLFLVLSVALGVYIFITLRLFFVLAAAAPQTFIDVPGRYGVRHVELPFDNYPAAMLELLYVVQLLCAVFTWVENIVGALIVFLIIGATSGECYITAYLDNS